MKPTSSRVALLSLMVLALAACSTPARDLPDGLYAEIVTSRGDIVIALEPGKAPATVMNFVGLAEGTIDNDHAPGKPFYNGLTFHRVEPGFVIQGGDPNGNGSGGPGYQFPTETHPELRHDRPGILAMANSGPDTNGSQFYITMSSTPHLDGGYNVFGAVVEGMEVVTTIEAGDVIREVNILRYGDPASAYAASQDAFDGLVSAIHASREQARLQAQAEMLDAIRGRWPNMTEYEETGMLLASLEPGRGAPPREGEQVRIHIVWSLPDGTQLDSTRDRGEPQRFTYLRDRMLRGLELAVGTMPIGSRTVAVVPPELAFGAAGMPPIVAPNSYVVFDIERLE